MKKTKEETLANLTNIEKQVICDMFEEGFALDDLNDSFMSWGVDGKQERGALASLVKKGVVCVDPEDEDGYRPVYLEDEYTKREVAEAVGYKL